MAADWGELLGRGLKGEALVREWLKLRDYYVLPTSLINTGGAPALQAHLRQRITASDIMIAKDGHSYWVEVKTYQRATFNQCRQRWEHGIPIRNWQQYQLGEQLTGIPGMLDILQLDKRLVLEGRLSEIKLGSTTTIGNHHPPSGPQIFFDVNRFTWYSLDNLHELDQYFPDDLEPVTVHPWERKHFPQARQIPLEHGEL